MTDRARLTAQLPAVPCEPYLRERVVELAKSQRRSIAYIQRQALENFLNLSDSNANTKAIDNNLETEVSA